MATFTFSCFTLSSCLKPSISPLLASTSKSWGRLQWIAVNGRVQPKTLMIRAAVDSDYSKYWAKSSSSSGTEEIITLPGCDYNHWLIVMEFPKDPEPTRQQMIDTYLDTLASVLGSMEEAKKNMYAFSTTTYTGFQCTVDEATAEKFKGLPGVLWVLPDSHLDVKNKDYGGDKYINGKIVPCTYPTHRSKQRNSLKYETRRHDRRRDGPPPEWKSPR